MTKLENLLKSVSDYYYHGTSVEIQGPLRAGPYDSILWMAENPAVAQNYIPEAGIISFLYKPTFPEDQVCPDDLWLEIANMAGYKCGDFSYDGYNRLSGWCWYGEIPTYQDLVQFIENTLGYSIDGNCYNLKTHYFEDKKKVLPNNFKLTGELYFITLPDHFKILDITNIDSDLTNPQYNDFESFALIKKAGYHGVKINDYAQSSKWGNVSHTSIGIFKEYTEEVSTFSIPATNFDWDNDLSFKLTPEYINWFNKDKKVLV